MVAVLWVFLAFNDALVFSIYRSKSTVQKNTTKIKLKYFHDIESDILSLRLSSTFK